jgi:hypothetical protein
MYTYHTHSLTFPTTRFAFGAKTLAPSTFQFLDDGCIGFPVGRHIWKYRTESREMVGECVCVCESVWCICGV